MFLRSITSSEMTSNISNNLESPITAAADCLSPLQLWARGMIQESSDNAALQGALEDPLVTIVI